MSAVPRDPFPCHSAALALSRAASLPAGNVLLQPSPVHSVLFIFLSFTGFVLGGAFGIFTAGIDTNVGFDPKDPYRTPTAKEVLKDMGQRGISYAKNFAIVGAMFSCTECVVESVSKSLSTIKKCFLVLFKIFY